MDLQAYANDLKTKSAVERQLQILTEAVIRLGDDAERICPGPDWVGFHGMGNILRHGYHRVDNAIVWNTIKEELPPMRAAVEKALKALGVPPVQPLGRLSGNGVGASDKVNIPLDCHCTQRTG